MKTRPSARAVPCLLFLLLAPAVQGAVRDGWDVVDQAAKEFVLEDLTGEVLRSDQLMGKIVVIDFWATWCAPCLKELPDLAGYHQRLKARKDVVLLSCNVTDERPALEAFVKEKGLAFPVYVGDSLLGPYEVTSFPTKLILDLRKGRSVVRFRREGLTPITSLEARVEELLAGKN